MGSEPRLPVPWNEDSPDDLSAIEGNLRSLHLRIVAGAAKRSPPTVAMAQEWHRGTYRSATLPVAYYAGEIRDSDRRYPELFGYEVRVGTALGIRSADVPAELGRFEIQIRNAVAKLDEVTPNGSRPADEEQLRSVLTLCALAHGEWVRIHPFANGNGRTARVWANWCALRYGLPGFVRTKPRPDGDRYAYAAARSMRGDHGPMVDVFLEMLSQWQNDR